MPSNLHHITRRRKIALKSLSEKIQRMLSTPTPSEFLKRMYATNLEVLKVERNTLQHRIANGSHSSACYRKQARKKPIVAESEMT